MYRGLVLVVTFAASVIIGFLSPNEGRCPPPAQHSPEQGQVSPTVPGLPQNASTVDDQAPPAEQAEHLVRAAPAPVVQKNGTISVIVTQFLRPTLEVMIKHIREQSVPVEQIIVYQNKNFINDSEILWADPKYADIVFIHNVNYNTGFFGRFTIPLLLRTEFVAIFDDDTIPAKQWLENCLRIVTRFNAICGANGRVVIPPKRQMLSVKMPHPNDVEVDFVGHCWVFRREWVNYMWRGPPYTFATAEDIHFSATAWIYGGIRTMVPKMPKGPLGRKMWPGKGTSGGGERSLDTDENASWRRYEKRSKGLRGKVIRFWQRKGWKMVYLRSKGHVAKYTQTGGDLNMHTYRTY